MLWPLSFCPATSRNGLSGWLSPSISINRLCHSKEYDIAVKQSGPTLGINLKLSNESHSDTRDMFSRVSLYNVSGLSREKRPPPPHTLFLGDWIHGERAAQLYICKNSKRICIDVARHKADGTIKNAICLVSHAPFTSNFHFHVITTWIWKLPKQMWSGPLTKCIAFEYFTYYLNSLILVQSFSACSKNKSVQ